MSLLRTAAQFEELDRLRRQFAGLAEKQRSRAVAENQRAYSAWLLAKWPGEPCLADVAPRISQLAAQHESLDDGLLRDLCPGIGWRKDALAPLTLDHQPLPPAESMAALHRFFDWVGEEAFAQLHPVEQAALCQARLLEIAPFQRHNVAMAHATSCFWLLRAGYLFPLWEHEQPGKYEEYLNAAFKLDMQSLVDHLLRGENGALRMVLRN
ncbi:MAG TPA: hypothetical protein VGK99_08505 [Acidobacteriota bacterium]|jgi:hypothetical protein